MHRRCPFVCVLERHILTSGEAGAVYRHHWEWVGEFENFFKVSRNPTDQKQTERNPRDGLLLARHTHSEIRNNRDSGAELQRIIFHDMAWPLAEKHLKEQFKIWLMMIIRSSGHHLYTPCSSFEERKPIDYTSVKVNTDIISTMNTLAVHFHWMRWRDSDFFSQRMSKSSWLRFQIVLLSNFNWLYEFLCPIIHFMKKKTEATWNRARNKGVKWDEYGISIRRKFLIWSCTVWGEEEINILGKSITRMKITPAFALGIFRSHLLFQDT